METELNVTGRQETARTAGGMAAVRRRTTVDLSIIGNLRSNHRVHHGAVFDVCGFWIGVSGVGS